MKIVAPYALADDGSIGGRKSRRQPRFPCCATAEMLYNGMKHGGD
jgi:hypothetical protein